jgi:photosystem II stability/assembly factor-like uncharacterized protein
MSRSAPLFRIPKHFLTFLHVSGMWSLLFMVLLPEPALARQDTLYMSILSSRKHRLGALDNPVVGLFISTDAGATWKHKGWTGYIRVFYSEVGSDGVTWSACGNGVLRSTDRGITWRITTGWNITEVLKVKVDPNDPAVVYAATAYGVFRTDDSGETWRERNSGFLKPFVSDVIVDYSNSRRLLAASEDGIYESRDSGTRWKRIGLRDRGVRTILQHPNDKKVFFAGTEDDGVFTSRDGGKTWVAANEGLTNLTVYTIACAPSRGEILYVGTHGGGVFRSRNGGRSWRQAADGLTNQVVHSLVILPSNPSVLFAGTLNGGLFKSTDGGDHWSFNSQEEAQVWGLWVRAQ